VQFYSLQLTALHRHTCDNGHRDFPFTAIVSGMVTPFVLAALLPVLAATTMNGSASARLLMP
jgi:hypothetical protein